VCPGRGSFAPFRHRLPRNFAPSCWGGGGGVTAAAGAGRGVYVCPVDPQHGQNPHCGGETLYSVGVLHFESRSGGCTSRCGGVHASRTVVTRWFAARTGAASAVPGVWVILHSLWAAGLGFCMPGSRFIRSVPSPAAALCNFAPRAGGEGETSRLAAGAGRGVYVCPVDPQHGQDGDVVHIERVLLEKSSIRPVRHPPAGVSWWGD
jgi:hypothetical protein